MAGMGNVMNGFVMFWYREVTLGLDKVTMSSV